MPRQGSQVPPGGSRTQAPSCRAALSWSHFCPFFNLSLHFNQPETGVFWLKQRRECNSHGQCRCWRQRGQDTGHPPMDAGGVCGVFEVGPWHSEC